MAVDCAVLLFGPYMEGYELSIRMDHDALEWMLNLSDATSKVARWLLCLSEFYLYVVRRAGTKSPAADALFQLETGVADTPKLRDDFQRC